MSSSRSATTSTRTSSCRSGPPPEPRDPQLLETLHLTDFRGYGLLDARFGPGPQLIWGPNAAGKTSLVEAIVALSRGTSHRTSTDGELVRWGADLARVEGHVAGSTAGSTGSTIELVWSARGPGARKRIRINGVGRRSTALPVLLRTVLFAPEEMLLIAGSPSLRRAAIDSLAGQRRPAYTADLATYGRALAQRNRLLRAIREVGSERDRNYWAVIWRLREYAGLRFDGSADDESAAKRLRDEADAARRRMIALALLTDRLAEDGIEPILVVSLPDGKQVSYYFPPTGIDGKTTETLDPIPAQNGTLIPYKVCLSTPSKDLFCVKESFVIWGNP